MTERQLIHAPETTELCPECGDAGLVRVGSHSMLMCSNCPTDIIWKREKGQPNIYGGPVEEE